MLQHNACSIRTLRDMRVDGTGSVMLKRNLRPHIPEERLSQRDSNMFLRCTARGRIAGAVVLIAVTTPAARSVAQGNLFTAPPSTLSTSSHYVSATVFTWFTANGGQISGPWRPVEGRSAWDGTPAFFESQIKQMMAANIDVINVEQASTGATSGGHNWQNVNLFQALYNLRAQGYNVPKVAPLLDPNISVVEGWPSGLQECLSTWAQRRAKTRS